MLRFLAATESLPWDSTAANVYGDLRARLAENGQLLGSVDLLIAAHAIALDAVVVTHDQAFRRLSPMCRVQDWASDI